MNEGNGMIVITIIGYLLVLLISKYIRIGKLMIKINSNKLS